MPKTNVDLVTLIAINELAGGVGPSKEWWVPVSAPPLSNKIANRINIETFGNIIADQLGSAVNIPDRVYTIGDLPVGVSLENDDDPLSPTFGLPVILHDPYLDGKEWSIYRRGTEYLEKGPQWQNDVVSGGFRLTESGDYFVDGAKYFLVFKPVISSVMVTPDAVARFTSGIQVVTGSVTAGPSFDRKLILIQGASTTAPTYTLNPIYPENVLFAVRTGGGLNKQSIIAAPAGQTMNRGTNLSPARIILGEIDFAFLVRVGTVWYVVSQGERWRYVGHTALGGIPGPDVIRANRQTLLESTYPSMADYCDALEAALPGSIVALGAAAANPTRYARGSGQILVPRYDGWFPRFLDLGAGKDPDRGADGNRLGSAQGGQNKEHDHNDSDGSDGWNRLVKTDGTQTATAVDPDGSTTQMNIITARPMKKNGGSEARPENVGLPALIHV